MKKRNEKKTRQEKNRNVERSSQEETRDRLVPNLPNQRERGMKAFRGVVESFQKKNRKQKASIQKKTYYQRLQENHLPRPRKQDPINSRINSLLSVGKIHSKMILQFSANLPLRHSRQIRIS